MWRAAEWRCRRRNGMKRTNNNAYADIMIYVGTYTRMCFFTFLSLSSASSSFTYDIIVTLDSASRLANEWTTIGVYVIGVWEPRLWPMRKADEWSFPTLINVMQHSFECQSKARASRNPIDFWLLIETRQREVALWQSKFPPIFVGRSTAIIEEEKAQRDCEWNWSFVKALSVKMLFRSDVIYLMDLSAVLQDSSQLRLLFRRKSTSQERSLHVDHVISSIDLHKQLRGVSSVDSLNWFVSWAFGEFATKLPKSASGAMRIAL